MAGLYTGGARARSGAVARRHAVAEALEVGPRRGLVDDHGLAAPLGRLEHDLVAQLLDEPAQRPRPRRAFVREPRDGPQGPLGEVELDAVEAQKRLVLA